MLADYATGIQVWRVDRPMMRRFAGGRKETALRSWIE
jgi:hypothetical protein